MNKPWWKNNQINGNRPDWISFKDKYPISNCGVLIKILIHEKLDEYITSDPSYYYEIEDHLFYGYVFPDSDYIYIILNITTGQSLAWKILKLLDKKYIYWHYDLSMEKTE